MLSAWLDYTGNVTTGDRTWKFNERMGYNFTYFHFAVNLPVNAFPPYDYVGMSATNAHVFLSVYPTNLDNITDANINDIAQQAQALNALGRNVIMRLGPDCNGAWYPYGQSPTPYIALFRRMSTIVRNATNATAIMWAPSVCIRCQVYSTRCSLHSVFMILC